MKKKRTLRNLLNDVALRAAGLCLLGCMTILSSCDKSDNTTDGLDTADDSALYLLEHPAISVEPFGGGSPATRAALAMEEERQAFNVGEELGNIITLGNSEVEDIPQTRAFANGTYYRIVIYKLSEWNAGTLKIYEQRLCKTGSAAYFADMGDSTKPVYLKRGDYRIFCYSFNKTTTDKMTPLTDGAANVPLSDGDDFLSSDIISKSIGESQFDTSVGLGTITLKHRCCRLIGTLTAEDFTGVGIAASPAPSLSVTSAFTTAGNWSIKNTSFGVTASVSSTKIFSLDKSGNNYTGTLLILPLSGKALAASYTFKPNGAPKNAAASNKSIKSGAIFGSGGSYSFTIKAVGAYVVTEGVTAIKIGNYTWAYANLNGSNKKMETYPWVSGQLNGGDNDYWRWNVLNIDTEGSYPPSASTWSTSTDPCTAGLGSPWKVPPMEYFDNLIGYKLNTKKVYINGVTAITDSYGWVSSGTVKGCVFVDTGRGTCIFLPAAGYRNGNSFINTGTYGYYWSVTLDSSNTKYARHLNFRSGGCYEGYSDRYCGFPLRCSRP